MDQLTRLAAISEIRQLKATYWCCADVRDWNGVQALLTEDMVWDSRHERRFARGLPPSPLESVQDAIAARDPGVIVGGPAAVDFMRTNMARFKCFHMGGAPIIDVMSDDQASAIWPFFDHLGFDGDKRFRGYGHYHEDYRRVDGRWLIAGLRMTRVFRDRGYGDYPIVLGSRKD